MTTISSVPGCLWGEYYGSNAHYQQSVWLSMLQRRWGAQHFFLQFNSHFDNSIIMGVARSGTVPLINWVPPRTGYEQIPHGVFDSVIKAKAEEVKKIPGRVVMTFWAEVDAKMSDPTLFHTIWAHTRGIWDRAGVTNVEWCFCGTGYGFTGRWPRAQKYCPPLQLVDWVAADGYCWPYKKLALWDHIFTPFYEWAETTGKPVAIPEFGVGQGDGALTPQVRAEWLASARDSVKRMDKIKLVTYFNSDPSDSVGIDWRINNDASLAAWKAWGQDTYFSARV